MRLVNLSFNLSYVPLTLSVLNVLAEILYDFANVLKHMSFCDFGIVSYEHFRGDL